MDKQSSSNEKDELPEKAFADSWRPEDKAMASAEQEASGEVDPEEMGKDPLRSKKEPKGPCADVNKIVERGRQMGF